MAVRTFVRSGEVFGSEEGVKERYWSSGCSPLQHPRVCDCNTSTVGHRFNFSRVELDIEHQVFEIWGEGGVQHHDHHLIQSLTLCHRLRKAVSSSCNSFD